MIRFVTFWRGDGPKPNCSKTCAINWHKKKYLRVYKVGSATYVDETFDEFIRRRAAEEAALKEQSQGKRRGRPKGSRNQPGHKAGRPRKSGQDAPQELPAIAAAPSER